MIRNPKSNDPKSEIRNQNKPNSTLTRRVVIIRAIPKGCDYPQWSNPKSQIKKRIPSPPLGDLGGQITQIHNPNRAKGELGEAKSEMK